MSLAYPVELDRPYSRIFGVALRSVLRTRYDRRKETFNTDEKFTLSGEISVPARANRDDAQDRSLPVFIRATSVWSVRQHPTERISRRRLLRSPFRGDRKMIKIAVRWNLVDLRDLQSWRVASNFAISLIYESLDTLFIILAHLREERGSSARVLPAIEMCLFVGSRTWTIAVARAGRNQSNSAA